MTEWYGHIIELADWGDFAQALNNEARRLNLTDDLAVRNFDLVTFDLDPNGEMEDEVDRLSIVRRTGTDRDSQSTFWNASGHDHDHSVAPVGRTPADIIYAYVVTLTGTDYLVRYDHPPEQPPETMDLTEALGEGNAILVYDASKLRRVAKNELWFLTDPKDALAMVFRLKPEAEAER